MASASSITDALNHVGYLGRFQIIFLVIFVGKSAIQGSITFQFQALSIMPKVICLSQKCKILQEKEKDETLICHLDSAEWKFDDVHHNWMTEFKLYCDNTYLKGMGTTVYFIGFMIGVSILSSLCDKFGRRKTNIILLLGFLLAIMGLHQSTSLTMVYFFRFILGFFHSGLSVCVFTAFCEFTTYP
jgi:MFS family permease